MLLFPARCSLVAHVDVERVRASPYGNDLTALLGQAVDRSDRSVAEALQPLVPKTRDIHVCLAQNSDPSARMLTVLLVRGNYAEGEFEALLPQFGLQDRNRTGPREWASEIVRVTEIDPGVWVIGDQPVQSEIVSRAKGTAQGPSPREDTAFQAQAEALGFGSGAAEVIAFRAGPSEPAAGNARLVERIVADLTAVSGRLDLSRDVQVFLRGNFADPGRASEHADAVRSVIGQYAQNMFVGLLGVGPILQRIEVRQEGAWVTIRASATEGEVRDLLGRFGRLMARMVADGG